MCEVALAPASPERRGNVTVTEFVLLSNPGWVVFTVQRLIRPRKEANLSRYVIWLV